MTSLTSCELAVAWGIKKHVRQLLAARDTAQFQREWARLEHAVNATRLPEPVALFTPSPRGAGNC